MKDKYFTCDRCCYDIEDEDGTIGEHYCIDDELYIPIRTYIRYYLLIKYS